MSQRSQIEWLKFSRLRNKPLITCTDQCEYYCFHIFLFFFVFRFARSLVRPLRDNRHFLFPIRKSDACNKLEKVWPQGSRKAACSVFWNFSKTRANGLRSDSDRRVAKTTGFAARPAGFASLGRTLLRNFVAFFF